MRRGRRAALLAGAPALASATTAGFTTGSSPSTAAPGAAPGTTPSAAQADESRLKGAAKLHRADGRRVRFQSRR